MLDGTAGRLQTSVFDKNLSGFAETKLYCMPSDVHMQFDPTAIRGF